MLVVEVSGVNVFAVVSFVLLTIILLWAAYHGYILFAGIRGKNAGKPDHVHNSSGGLPKFSLIVPAKDEAVVVSRCLDSLLALDYPKDKMEIIVVAGGSSDSTCEVCQGFSKRHPGLIRTVIEGASRGKPAALNLALSYATGDIVGVFDADSVPQRSVLRKVVPYFEDADIVAVQGSTSAVNEAQNMLTHVASMEHKAWSQGLLHGREKLGLFVAFMGSCQFIRRDILLSMGGWATSALAEDVELSLKLAKQGYSVKFAPEVCSGQETPFSLKGLITQRTRWYRGYMEEFFRYGPLLEKVNRRTIDAELSLVGPFVMILCLAGYVNWGLSLLFSSGGIGFAFSPSLAFILNSITLVSLGLSMTFLVKPFKVRNFVWVPFVYLYWFLQMFIALRAFSQILLRRRGVWAKTVKSGFTSKTQ